MSSSDQRGRQVLIDEGLLRQLINQAQLSGQRQALVPTKEAVPDEYRVLDEESINDDEIDRHTNDAVEIDLNRNRNNIPRGTFG